MMIETECRGAQGNANSPSAPSAGFLGGAAIAALLAIIAAFLPGVPAAQAQTPGSTRLENMITSAGKVSHRWSDDNGASWSSWTTLDNIGGPDDPFPRLTGIPAVVSDGYEHLWVVAVSASPSSLSTYSGIYYNTAYNHGSAWNGWTMVPGVSNTGVICIDSSRCFVIASSPAIASWGPGRVDLFVIGISNDSSDGTLLHTWADNDTWSGTWESVGEGLLPGSTPAVVSFGSGRIDIFTRLSDNAVYHEWLNNGQWSGWENLGPSFSSPPAAASPQYGLLTVFARGFDGHLWGNDLNSNIWGGWYDIGCCLSGDADVSNPVAATSLATFTLDAFVIGTDHALYRKTHTRTGGWLAWQLVDASISYTNVAVAGWVPIAPPPPPPPPAPPPPPPPPPPPRPPGCHPPCVLPE